MLTAGEHETPRDGEEREDKTWNLLRSIFWCYMLACRSHYSYSSCKDSRQVTFPLLNRKERIVCCGEPISTLFPVSLCQRLGFITQETNNYKDIDEPNSGFCRGTLFCPSPLATRSSKVALAAFGRIHISRPHSSAGCGSREPRGTVCPAKRVHFISSQV